MKVQIEEFNNLLSEVLGRKVENLNINNTPIDIEGWDSLNHVYLIIKLESYYKIKFSTAQIQHWTCVGDIINDINLLLK
jgi:acyl carrier protein